MEKSPTKKGPGHFLVRNTGEVVPLIPVDELPPDIEVVGAPRSLDLTATIGMLNLGLVKGTGHVYSVVAKKKEDGDKKKKVEEKEKEKEQVAIAKPSVTTKVAPAEALPPPKTAITSPLGGLATSRHCPANATMSPTQTCKHWCMHGICKWGQNCRYLHIMPMTLSGLREAGLNDWPIWYRNMNPGYFHDSVVLAQVHQHPHPHSHAHAQSRNHAPAHARRGDCCAHHYHGMGINPRRAAAMQKKEDERAGLEVLQRLSSYTGPGPLANQEKEKEKENEMKRIEEEQIRKILKKKKDAKVMVERAAGRDARDWEDDSSESSTSEVEVKRNNAKAVTTATGGMTEKEGKGMKKKSDEKKMGMLVDV